MRLSRDHLLKISEDIPKPLWGFTLLPVATAILGYYSGLEASVSNVQFFLSTLAGAQAGVLAIVFSVTVIGVQLVSTKYSPRMISLFTESPILSFTFGVFVGSVALDLLLLLVVTAPLSRMASAGVYAASGAGVLAVASLYVFIRRALYQSTPEGVIEAFLRDLTTSSYIERVQKSVNDEFKQVHPMRPLYSLIMSALSNRERATAEFGLEEYGRRNLDVLDQTMESDYWAGADREASREMFQPVLKEHLHDIALHAEDQDENQLVTSAVKYQLKLGDKGLGIEESRVSKQAVRGLTQVIIHAPIDEGRYQSVSAAWRQLAELMKRAAEHPRPEVVVSASQTVQQRVSHTVWKSRDIQRIQYSMTDLYQQMKEVHKALLEQYRDDLAPVEMNWQYESVPDEIENRERIRAFYEWREALCRSSAVFLHALDRNGEYPIADGNLATVWQNVCVQASKTEATDYAVSLCQAMIEVAVIESHLTSREGLSWGGYIGRVMYRSDSDVMEEAFERLLRYDVVEKEPGIFELGSVERDRAQYYQNQVNVEGYYPLNTVTNYIKIINQLRAEANEIRIQLRDD
jgi:hypothetical protein